MICVVDKQVCNRFVVGTYYTSGSGQEVRGVWEGEITFQGALATGKSYYITRTALHTCCLHSKHLLCMCIRYTLATEAIASLHLALYANKPSISLTYGALTGVAKIGQEQIQRSYSNTTVEDFAVGDLYTYFPTTIHRPTLQCLSQKEERQGIRRTFLTVEPGG